MLDETLTKPISKRPEQKVKALTLDEGKRTFPMSDKVLEIIKRALNSKTSNINGMIFWDYRKQYFITPCEINSYLKRLNDKYHITTGSLHSHRLRHTFITRCVENNVQTKVIQSLVVHIKGISITFDVYTSISNDFIAQELEKIN